jgi:hypothetical protein
MADWEYAKDCRIGQDQLSDEFESGLDPDKISHNWTI